jgi:hypothetical protein
VAIVKVLPSTAHGRRVARVIVGVVVGAVALITVPAFAPGLKSMFVAWLITVVILGIGFVLTERYMTPPDDQGSRP